MKGTITVLGALALSLVVGACSHSSSPTSPKYGTMAGASMSQAGGSVNGAGTRIPAFYDGKQFIINSIELSDVAHDHIVLNQSHNEIFVTNDLDDPQDFDPVLDAIQGDGFNPLWEQFKIAFNPGTPPQQFFSDTEVLDAAAAGKITLTDTGEVYRCSVVGTKQ
jgi:hypothetical protein